MRVTKKARNQASSLQKCFQVQRKASKHENAKKKAKKHDTMQTYIPATKKARKYASKLQECLLTGKQEWKQTNCKTARS